MNQKELLLSHLEKIHTTEMGIERIKRNLSLEVDDVVNWCINELKKEECQVTRKGKNWYAETELCIITVNVYSDTIITAHKKLKQE